MSESWDPVLAIQNFVYSFIPLIYVSLHLTIKKHGEMVRIVHCTLHSTLTVEASFLGYRLLLF